jgi:hypothetical protein
MVEIFIERRVMQETSFFIMKCINHFKIQEPNYGWMVRRVVVPTTHKEPNPRFNALVSHKGGIFF